LLALTAKLFDPVPLAEMTDAEHAVNEAAANIPAEVCERLDTVEKLSDEDRKTIVEIARQSLVRFHPNSKAESTQEAQIENKSKRAILKETS